MSSLLSTEWPLLTILTINGSKTKNSQKEHKHVFFGHVFLRQNDSTGQNCSRTFSLSLYEPKVQNTLGDTLLQHVTMTNHWLCRGQAASCVTRCNNKPALGNFCENRYLSNRILSLNKSLLIWVCVTCCRDKILLRRQGFSQNSPVHTKKFVIWLQCVAATCWCNLSPSVFRP